MRAIGSVLMGVGIFFLVVVAVEVFGPGLRGLGIDVSAQTTSVIGTALIGAFSFATGVLLRRRAFDHSATPRSIETPDQQQALGSGAAPPFSTPRRDVAEADRKGSKR